jgi:uncharacterized protein
MRGRLSAAAGAALMLAAGGGEATAAPPPMTTSSTYIRSGDGTPLRTEVFRPAGLPPGARTPVILIVGPYFGSQPYQNPGYRTAFYYQSLFDAAIPRGYTIVQVSLRGYGGSGGCSDFKGPGEQADAKAAVEWAASQPWSNGRVGMYGLSYDASTQVMALGKRPRGLAATVMIEPGTAGYRVVYMNGVRYVPFADSYEGHNALFWTPPPESVLSGLEGNQALLSQLMSDPACLAGRLAAERDPNPNTEFWRARDLAAFARHSRVPVFYVQGFLDANAHPDGLLPVWSYLKGPHHAWFGQFPHVIPGEVDPFTAQPQGVGRGGFRDEVMRWFDRYVRRGARASAADPAVEVQDGGTGEWRAEPVWPPADARRFRFELAAGSYSDAPGNKGEPYCFRLEGNCLPGRTGVGSWTFSRPLPYDAWLSGVPRLNVRLSAPASAVHLVGLLYDVAPGGQAALISRAATIAIPGRATAFDLYPQAWRLRRSHRIGLLLSGGDDGWFEPGTSGATVAVQGGTLALPFLRNERLTKLPGGPSEAMRQRSTFTVPASVIADRTRTEALPPPLACTGRLRLSVRPRRVRTERRVRFRFRVVATPCRARTRPARGALVRFAGARARTDRAGRATLVRRLTRERRYTARAQLRGFRRALATVTAAPSRRD